VVSVRIYGEKYERVSKKLGRLLRRHRGYGWDQRNGRVPPTLTVLTLPIQLPPLLSLLSCFLLCLQFAQSTQLLYNEVGSSVSVGLNQSSGRMLQLKRMKQIPHSENPQNCFTTRILLGSLLFLFLPIFNRTKILRLVNTLRPLLDGRGGSQHVLHQPYIFFHQGVSIYRGIVSLQDIGQETRDARVPVVVQPDGDDVAIFLILQRLQRYGTFPTCVQVIPQELWREQVSG
jgi:hypothetical protein